MICLGPGRGLTAVHRGDNFTIFGWTESNARSSDHSGPGNRRETKTSVRAGRHSGMTWSVDLHSTAALLHLQMINFCRHTYDLFPLLACSQVKELRHLISRELRFPNDRLKLIKGGSPLEDNAGHAGLADGGRTQCTATLPVRLACFSRLCRRPVRIPEHALPVTSSTFRLATALLCRCAPGAHPTPSASQASAGSV